MTYIGNEGFMVKLPSKKILVDALTSHDYPDYTTPSSETLEKMILGQTPFDDIDLILVSHSHMDHFSPNAVSECLSKNPETVLITTSQSVEKLKNRDKIKARFKALTPDFMQSVSGQYNGIDVKALRLQHSAYYEEKEDGRRVNRHEHVENLGFIVRSDDVTFFHSGDAGTDLDEFKNFKLADEHIDVAFVHFGFLFDSVGVKIIDECLQPDHLVLMHISPKYTERIINIVNENKDTLDNVIVFSKSMEQIQLPLHKEN